MSMQPTNERTLSVEILARVEGEGGLSIRLRDGKVDEVKLNIFEPPRFYEAFLRGRSMTELPDLTARICGICPVAYQFSACLAIEDACGVTVPDSVRALRRLLYCGEWIESQTLHIYMLHAPDFLGYAGAIEMAKDHPEAVKRGLSMKKAGNELMTLVGGRSVHPVNTKIGGFYKMPSVADMRALRPALVQGLADALETVKLVATFDFPDFERPYLFLSLRPESGYPIESGRVVTSRGDNWDVQEFTAAHRGGPRGALQRSARPARRRAVRGGPAGPVQPQLRPAVPAGPAGRARRGPGRDLPQPVQVDHRARRGDRRGLPRGDPDHRLVGRGPDRRRCRWSRGPPRASARPRPRAACASTGTRSTTTAW